MPSAFDELLKCLICNDELNNPVQIPCGHIFCKVCVATNVKQGKLNCAVCNVSHQVPGDNIEKIAKPSKLTEFLNKIENKEFDKLNITDDEKTEKDGVCPTCPKVEPKKKSDSKDSKVEPEPNKIKLALCFHCKKELCETCRNKHYYDKRMEAIKILEDYQEGSKNIVSTSEKLNDAREQKILDYTKSKSDISLRKIELTKKLEQEEQNLIKRLEAEILEEQAKITKATLELKRLNANKDATKIIRDKIVNEKNNKKLSELCSEFIAAQNEWKAQLTNEALRLDPNKEMKLLYTPSKLKDEIIGNLENKKGNLKIKQAEIPDSGKSKICTVL